MAHREKLPEPVATPEFFLHDIAVSLRELVDVQKALAGLMAGQVAYEASSPSRKSGSGQLPPDFPGRPELEAAGITAAADVPRTAARLKEIHGIGPATATEILKALK